MNDYEYLNHLYQRILRILLRPSDGIDIEKDKYIEILKQNISLLADTKPNLSEGELNELKYYVNDAMNFQDKPMEQIPLDEEGMTLENILFPILGPANNLTKELLKKDKLSLVYEILALRSQVSKWRKMCDSCEYKQEQDDLFFHIRNREGRTMENRTSDIDLWDENTRFSKKNIINDLLPEDEKGNFFSSSTNSTLQDFIIVIKAMYELRMFAKYDPTIQKAPDLTKQEIPRLSDVMDALGKAVNCKDLGKSYNSTLQKAKNKDRTKDDYDLTIFDCLKAIAEYRLNNKPLSKSNK